VTRKSAAAKRTSRKSAARKSPARNTSTRKTPARKTSVRKTTGKTAGRKSAGKKTAKKSAKRKTARKTTRKSASRKSASRKSGGRKSGGRKSGDRTSDGRRWSAQVTAHSDALTLEDSVFTRSPAEIAQSLKRSAERSRRRKSSPYRSAMSMLTFYANRAGKNLSAARRKKLDNAKEELRKAFGKA
jgi:hypothetical protein